MSIGHAIQTLLELAGGTALIVALLHERRIAILERRFFRRIKKRFKK